MYIYRHRGERLQPGMVNSMSKCQESRAIVPRDGRADGLFLQNTCIEIRKPGRDCVPCYGITSDVLCECRRPAVVERPTSCITDPHRVLSSRDSIYSNELHRLHQISIPGG
jgi:hypothetical protein